MTERWMSLREYARRRGCSLYAVQTAIATGRVTAVRRDDNGRVIAIEAIAADAQWAANTDQVEAARTGADPTRGAVMTLESDQPEVGGDLVDAAADAPAGNGEAAALAGGGPSDTNGYQASRADRERSEAQLARIKLLERLQQIGSIEGFQRAVTAAAQMVQDRILQVPSRLSALLAAETDPIKIENLLQRELKDALDGIAQRAAELARTSGGNG
jgi:hypothetical protein